MTWDTLSITGQLAIRKRGQQQSLHILAAYFLVTVFKQFNHYQFFLGLSISYWLLNKFQESWGQEMFRYTGEAPYITDKDVACCNRRNCNDAWCNNADCAKLIRDPCAWIFMIFFFIVWIVCIIYNCTESPANGETCITPGAFNKCYMF